MIFTLSFLKFHSIPFNWVEVAGPEPNTASAAVSINYKRSFYLCNELVTIFSPFLRQHLIAVKTAWHR